MKKAISIAAALLAAAVCLGVAFASNASDPLVSLSYLTGFFSQNADSSMDSSLNQADQALYGDVQQELAAFEASARAAAGEAYAPTACEAMLNLGDSVTGPTGLIVVPLAGDIQLTIASGAVVDVSDGKEIPSGSTLQLNHRYLVAEQSLARFTALSPTALLSYQGKYGIARSGIGADYFAIAGALRQLGLMRGTGTGIGEGFDLHLAPTRAESLVMFIRILGEESQALACTDAHPFTDVPPWADRYVAWAYARGYTNGVGNNKFGTAQHVTAVEYEEFILRALGYSVAGIHDYSTSLERGLELGALTNGEYRQLKENTFLRAQVAYLSFYSLDMFLSGSQLTLAQRLESAGVFDSAQLYTVRSQITSPRIS